MTRTNAEFEHHAGVAYTKLIDELRDFIAKNNDEVHYILEASGVSGSVHYAEILANLLAAESPEKAALRTGLLDLRDEFVDVPFCAGSFTREARSDLEAAVRWFGARLDEFIWSLS